MTRVTPVRGKPGSAVYIVLLFGFLLVTHVNEIRPMHIDPHVNKQPCIDMLTTTHGNFLDLSSYFYSVYPAVDGIQRTYTIEVKRGNR
jgi:hypothetical protein